MWSPGEALACTKPSKEIKDHVNVVLEVSAFDKLLFCYLNPESGDA